MDTSPEITEIKESTETTEAGLHPGGHTLPNIKTKIDEAVRKKRETPLDDFNWLIEALDNRDAVRGVGPSCSRSMSVDLLRRSAMKRPVRLCSSPVHGAGGSESVALKQALRRLSLSQASEMAAVKRLSRPVGLSAASEAGTIERLYEAVVVRSSESGNEEKGNSPRLPLVPGKLSVRTSERMNHLLSKLSIETSNKSAASSAVNTPTGASPKLVRQKLRDIIASPSQEIERIPHEPDETMAKPQTKTKFISICDGRPGKAVVIPHSKRSVSNDKNSSKTGRLVDSSSTSECSSCQQPDCSSAAPNGNRVRKNQSACPASNNSTVNGVATPRNEESASKKPDATRTASNVGTTIVNSGIDNSRALEKEECSQSSQSSMGDYSSTTSTSGDSNQSGFCAVGNRPHMSNDVRWRAIRDVEMRLGSISLKNFKLIKRLGCGDIGTVYLAELISSGCLFALKVMDNDFLISRKKITRSQTEREILQMLDHPFLPTLYTYFTTDNLSCLVMEYCPGGDLHVLRQKQLGRSFPEPAARFYVAEVLLALEYLHMLGVIYRDLKPENILVREDGHIMLSDFDLSLRCSVNAVLLGPSANTVESARLSGACAGSNCIDPLCLRPSCAQYSCFTPRLASARTRRLKSDHTAALPQLVVEPTEARSNSFVGTHEYLAPEIIKGEGHGSSVDWWTLGVFLYELLYGRTPFRGAGNDETLANIISQSLWFPDNSAVSFRARDLICGLLVKEPENRLGSVRGAAEIKQHPFFHGLNWALIRCATPPEMPRPCSTIAAVAASKEVRPNEENAEIEMF